MIAKRIVSILPPMDLDEALEVTKIHSIARSDFHQKPATRNQPCRRLRDQAAINLDSRFPAEQRQMRFMLPDDTRQVRHSIP